MAVASFVLGIISFITSFIPILGFVIAFICSILGILFGVFAVHNNKVSEKSGHPTKDSSLPKIGLVLSFLGFVIAILLNAFLFSYFSNLSLDSLNTIKSKIVEFDDSVELNLDDAKIVIKPGNDNKSKDDNEIYNTLPASNSSNKNYSLGETFENAAISFSIIDFNNNYSVSNSSTIATNKKVIQLTIKVQNLTDSPLKFNTASLHVTDDDSVICSRYYSTSDTSLSDSIEAHSSKVYTLKYLIPTNTKNINVKYDMYPISYDNINFILENN